MEPAACPRGIANLKVDNRCRSRPVAGEHVADCGSKRRRAPRPPVADIEARHAAGCIRSETAFHGTAHPILIERLKRQP